MSVNFNMERAAKALVDAILMGDRAAAEKYNVTIKSLEGWRVRLETDKAFREFFQRLRKAKDEGWADDIPAALASCIAFLKRAGQEADPSQPEAIEAIAHAAETLSDIALTRKVVDERFSQAREENQTD